MMRRTIVLAAIFGLLAAACTNGGGTPTPPPPTSPFETPTPPPEEPGALPGGAAFATLADVKLLANSPAYAGPRWPHSLDEVRMSAAARKVVSDSAVGRALERQGFVVVPSDARVFFGVYIDALYNDTPVFVTTDVAYHYWHLAFDKVLRDLEQKVLLPELEDLVSGLLAGARGQAVVLKGAPLADDADRVFQLMQVAATVLGLDTGPLGPLAKKELVLMEQHARRTISPIFGGKGSGGCITGTPGCIDYSLFTPRGHYTRTKELTRYFLGMSVLGQSNFCTGCGDPRSVRMGILATRLLLPEGSENGGKLVRLWRDIYEPTAFLVGLADDYTPVELALAVEEVVPSGLDRPQAYAKDAVIADVVGTLEDARPVRINPEGAGVRIMGARFVVDSYILDQLLYPNVGTDEKPRSVASPLDLAASFGSALAYRIQKEAGETEYANYDSQMEKVRAMIEERPTNQWGATVYDAWLWAVEPMWRPHGKAFPDFMRTGTWATKALQTGFGSYAELKHDTILYTKQAVAEGEGPSLTGIRSWVEPDPVAFMRLSSMAGMMQDGLAARHLLTKEQAGLLKDVRGLFDFLGGIATDELAGEPISEADNYRVSLMGEELEGLYWRTGDQAKTGWPETDEDAAIIADIAGSPKGVVEVATGRIDRIYVLVPNDEGDFQLAVGGVYSYYEFVNDERLTDETWRQMLDQGKAPDRPEWEEAILAGA